MGVKSFIRSSFGLGPTAYDLAIEEMMKIRRLATRLWVEDGGHVHPHSRNSIHDFMVQHPETRLEYEEKAKAKLGVA